MIHAREPHRSFLRLPDRRHWRLRNRKVDTLMYSDIIKGRFAAKTKLNPSNGCIEWVAAVSRDGYGVFHTDGNRTRSAHRVAFEMHKGAIPSGMFVCHRCDNPICVNPDHLFLGTHAENMRDRNAKRRQAGAIGETNGRAKLSAQDILSIKGERGPQEQLAQKYGVSSSHISRIRRGETWRHLEKGSL